MPNVGMVYRMSVSVGGGGGGGTASEPPGGSQAPGLLGSYRSNYSPPHHS